MSHIAQNVQYSHPVTGEIHPAFILKKTGSTVTLAVLDLPDEGNSETPTWHSMPKNVEEAIGPPQKGKWQPVPNTP